MQIYDTTILSHEVLSGGYRMICLRAPAIADEARPGQFIHLRIPNIAPSSLRRPFSLCKADAGVLSILYKEVGRGTEAMGRLHVGDAVNIIGPLGNTFPIPAESAVPLLIAGGFGVAPLLFLAERLSPRKGILFVGGRTCADVLLVEEFKALNWETQVCTNDGSFGTKGFVTAALDAWQSQHPATRIEMYCCGPEPLLEAVDKRAVDWGVKAWLSLDRRMGCGMGACLGCVQMMKRTGADGTEEKYRARVCKDGPIFKAGTLVWED